MQQFGEAAEKARPHAGYKANEAPEGEKVLKNAHIQHFLCHTFRAATRCCGCAGMYRIIYY